jgi:histidinol dehydrogenase
MLRILKFSDPDFKAQFAAIEGRGAATPAGVEETVKQIIAEVRSRGDAALFELTARFDRLTLTAATVEVPAGELDQALHAITAEDRQALELAAARIGRYHAKQKQETWLSTDEEDVLLGQMVRPLDRVGIYVPGGKAAYPSSGLMNAIPAKDAGVAEVIMVVPMPDGRGGIATTRRAAIRCT